MSKQKETELYSAYVAENETIQQNEYVESQPTRKIESPITRGEHNKFVDDIKSNARQNLGYLKIDVKSLPTQGLFYPDGIEISIRAARGEEIKHWSTMNEYDLQQQSIADDIINYVIERCVLVKIPDINGNSWLDLKNIDRLYLLLAIREFTFTNDNPLMVPYKEGQDIPIVKEMIDFVSFPDDVMEYYNSEDKCFTFNVDGTRMNIYLPSVGVNNWLKKYLDNKTKSNEMFDFDFYKYAGLLIRDHRQLTIKKYEDLVNSTRFWGHKEWSVLSYVFDALDRAASTKVKYTDESGTEVAIPLNFRGGFKAIFLLSNPLFGLH